MDLVNVPTNPPCRQDLTEEGNGSARSSSLFHKNSEWSQFRHVLPATPSALKESTWLLQRPTPLRSSDRIPLHSHGDIHPWLHLLEIPT